MPKSNDPLVSVITVTFNPIKSGRKDYLIQSIESVHSQSYSHIEHIVIDGGSSDGTVELLKKYVDLGWLTYISEKDTGIYDAMNKGIDLAKGKYVAFLNSDDYYHNVAGVKRSITALEKHKADFSYSSAILRRENSRNPNKSELKVLSPTINDVFHIMPFCHQTMITLRDTLIKEGKFDTTFKNAGDYDLVLRLCLKNYKSVLIDGSFVTYRLGGVSETLEEKSIDEIVRIYLKNYRDYSDLSLDECSEIFYKEILGIPLSLADKLRDNIYFDYTKYSKSLDEFRLKAVSFKKCCESKSKELETIYTSRTWKIIKMMKMAYKVVTLTWIFNALKMKKNHAT